MTEFWVSTPRHFCSICNCWLSGNRLNISNHENSERHVNNLQAYMRKARDRAQEKERNEQEVLRELHRVEAAALKTHLGIGPTCTALEAAQNYALQNSTGGKNSSGSATGAVRNPATRNFITATGANRDPVAPPPPQLSASPLWYTGQPLLPGVQPHISKVAAPPTTVAKVVSGAAESHQADLLRMEAARYTALTNNRSNTAGTPGDANSVPANNYLWAAGIPPVASSAAGIPPVPSSAAGIPPVVSSAAGIPPVPSSAAGIPPVASSAAGIPPVASSAAGIPPVASSAAGIPPVASSAAVRASRWDSISSKSKGGVDSGSVVTTCVEGSGVVRAVVSNRNVGTDEGTPPPPLQDNERGGLAFVGIEAPPCGSLGMWEVVAESESVFGDVVTSDTENSSRKRRRRIRSEKRSTLYGEYDDSNSEDEYRDDGCTSADESRPSDASLNEQLNANNDSVCTAMSTGEQRSNNTRIKQEGSSNSSKLKINFGTEFEVKAEANSRMNLAADNVCTGAGSTAAPTAEEAKQKHRDMVENAKLMRNRIEKGGHFSKVDMRAEEKFTFAKTSDERGADNFVARKVFPKVKSGKRRVLT